MALNKRQGRNVIDYVKYEKASGIRMDPGPHVGIVQHVVDSTRSGRLIVFLPHLGGDPNNVDNCRIVSYASPFFGTTNLQVDGANNPNTTNEFDKVRHSYGMWFTPPDVGIKVLVVFETGDTNNGYWFACIPGTGEHNNVASLGGATRGQTERDGEVDAMILAYGTDFVPSTDYNSADHVKVNAPGMHATKRPPHKTQTFILANQGLLGDEQRGINDSSSVRESPSGVFGITTPGRPYKDQMTDKILQRTAETPPSSPPPIAEKVVNGRKGGHSFIMDDGDVYGESRMVRLRTSAGHQIMMNDTEGFMYISNSTGTNWIELTNDGNMYVYAEKDIAVRCGGDMSYKIDKNFKIEVDGNMHIKVKKHMQIENGSQADWSQKKRTSIIGENYSVKSFGSTIMEASGFSVLSSGDVSLQGSAINLKAAGTFAASAGGTIGLGAGGAVIASGSTVQLNSGGAPSAGSASSVDVPDPLPQKELLDAESQGSGGGTVWKYQNPSEYTEETTLDIIPTHEPFDGRKEHTVPLVGSGPASGPPTVTL